MATMKAVRVHAYGGPEVLVYEEAPMPVAGDYDVLIKVQAAGVNPVDWKVREGYLREMLVYIFPIIPGWDVAGVIAGRGSRATGFEPGETVYAHSSISRDGAYAQYVAVRATEVALKPQSLDFDHAAAVPLAALTAWQGLFDIAGLKRGQTVLIHAAAGGVGHFAVQFARWAGAHVIGTASAGNQEVLRQFGVHEAIDYGVTPFEEVVRDADVVLDTLGGEVWERSWRVLKKGGILVSTLHSPPAADLEAARGKRGVTMFVRPSGAQLGEIAELIDAGHVKPMLAGTYPLAEAARAQQESRGGHVRGKIVLRV